MGTESPKTVRHRRASPYTWYPGHNATIIEIDGEPEEIDTRIVELIQVMNATPGLRTTGSCRGGRGPRYKPGNVLVSHPATDRCLWVGTRWIANQKAMLRSI
jgi:hypothetical protein